MYYQVSSLYERQLRGEAWHELLPLTAEARNHTSACPAKPRSSNLSFRSARRRRRASAHSRRRSGRCAPSWASAGRSGSSSPRGCSVGGTRSSRKSECPRWGSVWRILYVRAASLSVIGPPTTERDDGPSWHLRRLALSERALSTGRSAHTAHTRAASRECRAGVNTVSPAPGPSVTSRFATKSAPARWVTCSRAADVWIGSRVIASVTGRAACRGRPGGGALAA